MLKTPFSKAAASEEPRRTLRYVESLSDARKKLADFFSALLVVGQHHIKPDHYDRRHDIHRLLAEAIVDAIDQDRGHEGEVELPDPSVPRTVFRRQRESRRSQDQSG